AVGCRLRDLLGGDVAAGAGAVLDDHRLAYELRELLRHRPRREVGAAAGREAHDHANRPNGIRVCRQCSGEAKQSEGGASKPGRIHVSLFAAPSFTAMPKAAVMAPGSARPLPTMSNAVPCAGVA